MKRKKQNTRVRRRDTKDRQERAICSCLTFARRRRGDETMEMRGTKSRTPEYVRETPRTGRKIRISLTFPRRRGEENIKSFAKKVKKINKNNKKEKKRKTGRDLIFPRRR